MSYLIFARKFRPQTFEDVIGQEPITTTLVNAIQQERIPQNFLFAGPRGIGKTSTARILAKALNCAKGPTARPCGKCASCTEITQGNAMDVLEIDGASNRGIDEIRNLRETVKFKPVSGRFKIYIIDEVHMLTTEAFNALLKTLEEPPQHVKFVFATTESHKVPLTILSRCQRFNFKRIPTAEIQKKLEAIVKSEKLKFEKNAVFQIAKASEGALRDAESLLDQLASFSREKITEADVLLALGLASEDIYFSVLSAVKSKDVKKIFTTVEELYEGGRDLVQFAKGLLEIFRHLLLFQCTSEGDAFVEMSDEGIAKLKATKSEFGRGELLMGLSILGNLQNQLRRNLAPPRLLVETALLKLVHLDTMAPLDEALSQAAPLPAPAARPSAYAPPAASPPPKPSSGGKSAQPIKAAAPPAPAQAVVADGEGWTLNQIQAVWPRVIDYVKTKRMSIGIFLSESTPVEVDNTAITLGLPTEFQFHREMLEKNANLQLVEEGFQVLLGQKARVQFVVTQAESSSASSEEPAEVDKGQLPEIINQAMEIFDGARIIRKD